MHDCRSITAWCVLVMLSFYDTCSGSTCYWSTSYAAMRYCIVWGPSWGPSIWGPSVSDSINTLWQPERLTWSVYRITCFFLTWYHTCYHVLPNVIWCYLSMIHALHVIDLCSPLRCDTVLYGDHMGIVDMGTKIWGPLIWRPSIYVDINITIYVDKINSVW